LERATLIDLSFVTQALSGPITLMQNSVLLTVPGVAELEQTTGAIFLLDTLALYLYNQFD